MQSFLTRGAFSLAIALGLGAVPAAQAADAAYPDHPITIVVPYSPGGGVDIVTRLVTKKMLDELGQSFVVDNRSEEHTSELQSLMRISYAVFCLKKKTKPIHLTH